MVTISIALHIVYCLFKKFRQVRDLIQSLKKRIWMNLFIRYILENYLVLVIAYMLDMQNLRMQSW